MRAGNRLRHDNCVRIAERLWRYPGKSRSELARDLRLDRSTVSQLADTLVAADLLQQVTDDSSGPNGGRPPARLWIKNRYGYALGLELTSPLCRIVATDLSGEVLAESEFPRTRLAPDLIDGVIHQLLETQRDVDLAFPTLRGLLTVGVGVSGVVNEREGRIDLSHALGITSPLAFSSPLRARLGFPVALLNDAQSSAVGESGMTGTRDLLLALVEFRSVTDVGVGLGLVLGGRLRRGRTITHLLRPQEPGSGTNPGIVSFPDSLSHALALVANATGVSDVVLAGDVDKILAELQSRIPGYMQWAQASGALGSAGVSVRQTNSGAWSVSFGASYAAIQRLLHTRELPIDAPGVRADMITGEAR